MTNNEKQKIIEDFAKIILDWLDTGRSDNFIMDQFIDQVKDNIRILREYEMKRYQDKSPE